MKLPLFSPRSGMTLVEMLLAIALSLMLMLGIFTFFFEVKQRVIVHQGIALIQENARFLASYFENIIYFSGFLGCNRIEEKAYVYVHPPLTENQLGWETRTPVKKVKLIDLENKTLVPKSVRLRALPTEDILWINTVNKPYPIHSIDRDCLKVSGEFSLPTGRIFTIYDCAQNDILLLEHDPNYIPKQGTEIKCNTNKLSKLYNHAYIAELVSSLYYVGKTKRAHVFALYRTDLKGRTQEIVEGIEAFKITLDPKLIQISVLLGDPNKKVASKWFHYAYPIHRHLPTAPSRLASPNYSR